MFYSSKETDVAEPLSMKYGVASAEVPRGDGVTTTTDTGRARSCQDRWSIVPVSRINAEHHFGNPMFASRPSQAYQSLLRIGGSLPILNWSSRRLRHELARVITDRVPATIPSLSVTDPVEPMERTFR